MVDGVFDTMINGVDDPFSFEAENENEDINKHRVA